MTCQLVNELPERVLLLECKGTVKTKSKLIHEIINKVSSYIIEADFVEVAVGLNKHYWLFSQEEDFNHPDGVLAELEEFAAYVVDAEFPEIMEEKGNTFFSRIKDIIYRVINKDIPPMPEIRPKIKSAEQAEDLGLSSISGKKETSINISIQEEQRDKDVIMSSAIRNLNRSE